MATNFAPQLAYKHESYDVRYYPVHAGQTFIPGALVVYSTANHDISECGADPASILGVALAAATVGLDSRGSIYGGTRIPVAILDEDMPVFMASATTPDYNTHVGNKYGIVKSGNNWLLDTTDAVNTRVQVFDISPLASGPAQGTGQEGFWVKFLAANLQFSEIVS